MPNIETPPALRGEAQQQLAQLHSYLYRLAENLNVSLQDSGKAEAREGGGESQSPKALFEAIRPLISASGDILDVYYAEIYKKLLEVFVEIPIYEKDRESSGEAIQDNATAIQAVARSVAALQEAAAAVKDAVSETASAESGGLTWQTRHWSEGSTELWGSGSLTLSGGTEVSIALPEAVSGAAFVSLSAGYAQAVSISGGSLSFTPSESGAAEISIYIRSV